MTRVQEFNCSICGTFCQGFVRDGKTYCANCYKKAFDKWPWEDDDWDDDDED